MEIIWPCSKGIERGVCNGVRTRLDLIFNMHSKEKQNGEQECVLLRRIVVSLNHNMFLAQNRE